MYSDIWIYTHTGNIRTAQANAELKRLREELAEQERLAQEAREAEKDKIEYRKNKLKELEKQRFEKAQVGRSAICVWMC